MKTDIPFFRAEEIAEKSWMIKNAFVENSYAICYLVEGRDCALLIDTIIGLGNLKAFCETLTDKPIRVVNTHSHSDHVGGNFHFDHCYLHHRDIGTFQECIGIKKEKLVELAKKIALEEYRDLIEPDENFADWNPIRVFPICDGDVFDLGDRRIEVVEVGGHTAGSVVLIDDKTRIAFCGDVCNSNTLLEFDTSLPVNIYLQNLKRLAAYSDRFDMMYGGHEVFDKSIIEEGIETAAKVIAGTDDKVHAIGIMGNDICYAAARRDDSPERADGKRFNMSYDPARITGTDTAKQIIRA